MPSLQTVGRRFESTLYTKDGFPVKGAIIPADDNPGVSYDFSEPRITIRLRHNSSIGEGQIVIDPAGRKYLLATHDSHSIQNTVLYHTYLAFPINRTVRLERQAEDDIDLLTNLKKSTKKVLIGEIDVLIEMNQREDMDFAIKVREESKRLITGYPIQLNDIVDNMVVKRVNAQLGVWIAEIE